MTYKYNLSLPLGGIRKENWQKFYDSAQKSIGEKYTWELVLCGPYSPEPYLESMHNVKWIEDWGAPTRAYQRAIIDSEGEWLIWAADDGWFYERELEYWLDYVYNPNNKITDKTVLSFEYREGGNTYPHESFHLNYHASIRSHLHPNSYVIYNLPLIKTQFVKDLGGFDCRFESTAMPMSDFAARAQRSGADTRMIYKPIFEVTQYCGDTSDHIPIEKAFEELDAPLYERLYRTAEADPGRIYIDLNNWKDSPARWVKRFPEN